MPLYEYKCQSCGDTTEVIQRLSDPPLSTCERCGGDLKKLISAPAFQFKGSGWYVTDYAGKGGGGKAEASDKSKKDDASKSDSKDSSGGSDKSSSKAEKGSDKSTKG